MRFTVMANPSSKHQADHQVAITEGLTSLGCEVTRSTNRHCAQTKNVVCWGWRLGRELRSAGHNVLVCERGYLGNRFEWTSLAWNGLNGYGTFPEIDDGGKRFSRIAELKPWKEDGAFILIMGQVPGDQSLRGKCLASWYEETAASAADHYDFPVFFRAHPLAYRKGNHPKPKGITELKCDLDVALEDAALVVTYNSNSAVDALLAGVPAVSYDKGSMAWCVTGHKVTDVVRPAREKWAHQLAWKQWSLEEISSGFALKHLLQVHANGQPN